MRRILLALLITSLAGLHSSRGHDSPSHRIDALTARIDLEGPRTDSLVSRGFEYNALGDWSSAVADFEAALERSPRSWAALSGCAEACLRLGRWEQVAVLARKGISYQKSATMRAPFYALLARALMEQGNWERASEAWEKTMESPHPEIDWYLGQSECLYRKKEYKNQIEALEEARKRNPSVVLYRAWLEALVNTGRWEEALTEVNLELEKARWKSSWLLLRARIYQGLGNKDAQINDAKVAFEEIQLRIHPARPDPQLERERDQALALFSQNAKQP